MKTLMCAVILSLGGMAALPRSAEAKPGDIQIDIMAARIEWGAKEFAGYAFLCIKQDEADGGKEECYAFYPRDNGTAFVGGPGTTATESRKTPERFPTANASTTRLISDVQRQAIVKALDAWNEKEFAPSRVRCLELVRSLAQTAGFYVPPYKNERPDEFVRRLKTFNQ